MSPTRYRFSTPHLQTGEPGFEPGQTESKSGVLPLDDSPITAWRSILYIFSSFFQEKIKKNIKKDKNQISTIIFIHTPRQKLPPQKNITLHFCLAKISLHAFLFHKKISILESNMLNYFALSKGIPSISNTDFKFLDSKISHIWGINPISKNPLCLTDSIPPSKILRRI